MVTLYVRGAQYMSTTTFSFEISEKKGVLENIHKFCPIACQ